MIYNKLIFREIFRMYIVVTHSEREFIQNLISELKPSLNENVGSEELFLY